MMTTHTTTIFFHLTEVVNTYLAKYNQIRSLSRRPCGSTLLPKEEQTYLRFDQIDHFQNTLFTHGQHRKAVKNVGWS